MTASELIEELKRLPPHVEVDVVRTVHQECGNCNWTDKETAFFQIEGVDSIPARIRLSDGRIH